MVRRLRGRLSYANVTATLALFVALGGTSYAAITLPRNSVGSKQIRANAVGTAELKRGAVKSRDIRQRTIGVGDISTAARTSLRGATGPAGPQGPAGPSGVTYRAAIPAGGTVARGNATGAAHQGGTNEYLVSFPQNVDACVATATLATVGSEPDAGRINVRHQAGNVLVRTFDAAGASAERPFQIIVAC